MPIEMDFMDDLEALSKKVIINAITEYLDNKGEPKTSHVILDRVFPIERRIRSIIGGLETSMGIKLWEKLAKEIAKSSGFTIMDEKKFKKPEKIPANISSFISAQKEKREGGIGKDYDYQKFLKTLNDICKKAPQKNMKFVKTSSGDGIDLWLFKDDIHYIFDVKTVQINAGGGNNFANKVMHWYAYFMLQFTDAKVQAAIAFPYSPYSPHDVDSWWKGNGNRAQPLIKSCDALVQDEFWDLLSGEKNTWQRILSAIEDIDSTEFTKKYSKLFYGE